jgi:hypothetical protein
MVKKDPDQDKEKRAWKHPRIQGLRLFNPKEGLQALMKMRSRLREKPTVSSW